MVVEPLKKFAVVDMPPSPTTSNPISSNINTYKKSTRHHYKRRSNGRIHATKLTPMAKPQTQQQQTAEGDDNNINDDDDEDDNFEDVDQQKQRQPQHTSRKPMKRTHSNKSIHRLSSNDPHRKVNLSGFAMTSKSTIQSSSNQSPPLTPTDDTFRQNTSTTSEKAVYAPNRDNTFDTTAYSTHKTKTVIMPIFQVSHQATAAPIANTLNATANTLVTPDKPAFANLTTPNNPTLSVSTSSTTTNHDNKKATSRMKHLCSRFIRQGNIINRTTTGSNQSHLATDDISANDNIWHHFGDIEKEYQYIQTYQDPMVESLTRCMKQQQQRQRQNTSKNRHTSPSSQSQLQRLAQRGAQQRTLSSSILPTISTLDSIYISSPIVESSSSLPALSPHQRHHQHMEHRQLARRRHQYLQATYTSSAHHHSPSSSKSSEINKQPVNRWTAGALLDRVFYGAS